MILPKSKNILGFDDSAFYLLGCIINTSVIMVVLYMELLINGPHYRFIILWIGVFIFMLLHWYIMRFFYLKLVQRYPGYDNRFNRIVRLPLVLILYFLITFTFDFFLDPVLEIKDPNHIKPLVAKELITGTLLAITDIVAYEALHLFAELKNTKLKETTREKEQVTAQLINLKNQISPHFLFNSFSTLIYLIENNKEKSKEFVHKLASIYEATIELSEKDLVFLKDELKYIKAYTNLLEERFGNNLNFKIEVDDSDKLKKLIPLSIQLAVENAVKHNIITKKRPLNINIQSQDDYLIITNNLQIKLSEETNYGLGLKNIKKRYALLTKRRVVIEKGKLDFILKLPLLNE